MVSKITLLEPHFDGAQFGPATVDIPTPGGEESDETAESDAEGDESTSRLVTVLQGATVFAVLFAVLWTVLSRVAGNEENGD